MPKETLAALAIVIAAAAACAVVVGELDARFVLLEILAAALLALLAVVAALLAARRAVFERRRSATFAVAASGLALASGWTFVAPRGAHDPRQQPTLLEHALYVVDEVRGEVFLVSDNDGDGVADLVAVRGPRTNGSARIDLLSGASGAFLRTLWTPDIGRDHLRALRAGPDLNGDGASELLFGGISFDGAWRAKLISSRDGSVLRSWTAEAGRGALGSSVDFLGDLDGDGVDELALGSPPRGVRIMSGASGAELGCIDDDSPEPDFGSHVRALGDLDGDGVREWLVECGDTSSAPARIYSGLGKAAPRTLDTGRGWGGAAGDLDGDGQPDLYFDTFAKDSYARWGGVRCFSGRDGRELFTLAYPDWASSSSGSTAALGDLDGDGFAEIGVGDPNFHLRGPGDPGFTAAKSIFIERMSLEVALRVDSDPWNAFTHESGCAWIYSSKTRKVIWGAWGPPGSREGLGYHMARLDDVSGDGWPDIAVTSGDKLFVFRGPGRDPTLPRER